jgi:hypothetical protein
MILLFSAIYYYILHIYNVHLLFTNRTGFLTSGVLEEGGGVLRG